MLMLSRITLIVNRISKWSAEPQSGQQTHDNNEQNRVNGQQNHSSNPQKRVNVEQNYVNSQQNI